MTVADHDTTTKTRSATKRPNRYTAVFVNDDFTPMEFVVQILVQIFNQSVEDAEAIMMRIHRAGRGNVGLYTYEIAETKVAQAMDASKRYEYPLRCHVERA